jgi:phosphoribosylamine--glycine ligase
MQENVNPKSSSPMRFLGVGETCDLGSLYLALQREGHEVKVAVSDPLAQGTLKGMVDRAGDWRAELGWLKGGDGPGIILFESVSEGFGALQDELRAAGHHVIGGSAYGDRLENDRAFAQAVLAELGFPAGHVWEFSAADAADRFIAENPGRYVLKFCGAGHSATYPGRLEGGEDVRAMLASVEDGSSFILMQFIEGVEMGVGAYFNGESFLTPACLDWEHKRFFAGDLGELTGEMGTVVTYEGTQRFFEATLKKMESRLRENGYVGYINLNAIVNEQGIWPLEFTCRFGYPGYAILAPLQREGWGSLLRSVAMRDRPCFEAAPGFCTGIVMTTPPFPYSRHEVEAAVGLPVILPPDADPLHHHAGEVGLNAQGRLASSGVYGWTMVVTGVGASVEASQAAAYERIGKMLVPNGRYRLDIGDKLAAEQLQRLARLGVFSAGAMHPNAEMRVVKAG